jgi:hypothetical protein
MADPRKPAETPNPDRSKPDLPPPAPPVQEPPRDPQGGDHPGDSPPELPPRNPTLRQGARRSVGPEEEDRRLRPGERHPPGVNP